MTLREKIEVMEAFERGEEIEYRYKIEDQDIWGYTDPTQPSWDWDSYDYRIKTKPEVKLLDTYEVEID